MSNFPSNSLNRHPESLPEDSQGFMNRWVSSSPTSEEKGANRSLGFNTHATRQHDESKGSTTDGDSLECSVRGRQTTLSMQSSTPVFTDSRIIEHLKQMRTLISGFVQQKSTSDRQPYD